MDIHVHRYPVPTPSERQRIAAEFGEEVGFPSDTWQGWIEPDDKTWIAFVHVDGRPVFFLDRDPETGAVRD